MMISDSTLFRSALITIVFVLLAPPSFADIPQMISYQGRVTNSGGDPVTDGNYTMRFRIYDASTGGTMEWDSGNRTIAVSDGVFNVLLGESPQPSLDLEFDEDLWLLVTFAGVNQAPRQRLASAGYAYMASGLIAGTEVKGSVTSGTTASVKGTNTAVSGTNFGLYGHSYSTGGSGVYGLASATSGYVYGVYGATASTNGSGVYGFTFASSGPVSGVNGRSGSSSGRGVFGYATSQIGETYGVYGQTLSTAGTGVYGWCAATAGTTTGVYGKCVSTAGRGVYGSAEASSGNTHGVLGISSSSFGTGVSGEATASSGATTGVFGSSSSTSGQGMSAFASSSSGMTRGIHAQSASSSGTGVYGWASSTSGQTFGGTFESNSNANGIGVHGTVHGTSAIAVYGTAYSLTGQTYAIFGYNGSSGGRGVYGYVDSESGNTYGVYGQSDSPSGYGVYYSGGIGGSGLMRTVVLTSQGPTGLDAVSAAGSWVEDFGEGHLLNGHAHIDLDPIYLQTVTIDETNPMKVFVQLKGDCFGVYVDDGQSGFDVFELQGGTSSVPFTYRVVAKRAGFEENRLDHCKAAETDPYLYPELRAKNQVDIEIQRIEK